MRYAGEDYLVPLLKSAQAAGKAIFTVDYASKQINRNEVAKNSRAMGFVPFLGSKNLKTVERPAP